MQAGKVVVGVGIDLGERRRRSPWGWPLALTGSTALNQVTPGELDTGVSEGHPERSGSGSLAHAKTSVSRPLIGARARLAGAGPIVNGSAPAPGPWVIPSRSMLGPTLVVVWVNSTRAASVCGANPNISNTWRQTIQMGRLVLPLTRWAFAVSTAAVIQRTRPRGMNGLNGVR